MTKHSELLERLAMNADPIRVPRKAKAAVLADGLEWHAAHCATAPESYALATLAPGTTASQQERVLLTLLDGRATWEDDAMRERIQSPDRSEAGSKALTA